MDLNGNLLVSDRSFAAVLSIDLATEQQTVLSRGSIGSGPNLVSPIDIAVVPAQVPEPSSVVLLGFGTLISLVFHGFRCGRTRQLVAALVVAIAIGSTADAARLVVMAVDSGADLTAPTTSCRPCSRRAKGFLIGVDTEDVDSVVPLSVSDIQFQGPGLVNRDGIDLSDGILFTPPKIMRRSEALLQGAADGISYTREDTYMLDQVQSTPQGLVAWTPLVLAGGGSSDNFLSVTAYSGIQPTSGGIWPLAYVVTTSDLTVSGSIGHGSQGIFQSFDVNGRPIVNVNFAHDAVLHLNGELTLSPNPPVMHARLAHGGRTNRRQESARHLTSRSGNRRPFHPVRRLRRKRRCHCRAGAIGPGACRTDSTDRFRRRRCILHRSTDRRSSNPIGFDAGNRPDIELGERHRGRSSVARSS